MATAERRGGWPRAVAVDSAQAIHAVRPSTWAAPAGWTQVTGWWAVAEQALAASPGLGRARSVSRTSGLREAQGPVQPVRGRADYRLWGLAMAAASRAA